MPRGKQTHCARGHEMSLENAYADPSGRRYCRICKRNTSRKRVNAGTNRDAQRKHRYGLNPEQYQEKLRESEGRCAICHRLYETPMVDHDHVTKKVRDILCRFCNTGLGMFGDNIEVLENAVAYLRRHLGV